MGERPGEEAAPTATVQTHGETDSTLDAAAHGVIPGPEHSLTGRQASIDIVRALGVLAVVFYHYSYRFPPDYLHGGTHVEAFAYGRLGVNLFFIISAFCISGSLDRSRSAVQFFAKRVARLYPAYVFCVLVTFAAVAAFGLPGREVSTAVLLGNLVWVNMVLPLRHVDGAYWTLLVELRFYAVIGLLYFALRRDYDRVTLFWRVLTLVGIALYFVAKASAGTPAAGVLRPVAANLFLHPFAGYFLLGITLFRWERVTARGRATDVALFVAGVLCSDYGVGDKIVCLCFFPLTYGLLRTQGLRVPRVVLSVGLVSYPLYLLHQNIGLVVMRTTWPAIDPFVLRALLAFGVVLLGAFAVNYRIEPPLRRPFERALVRAGDAVTRRLTGAPPPVPKREADRARGEDAA
ncbi:acyltransferase [Sphingomonas sp. TZW2008]|uniref:acyltransferase family protein n=1 Tax=Sphingomonas sp. TZW2008 TaxID=1917973 RepID=UPI000A26E96D|nr:acyltransferase [Sphingomonas sp. TZW2008]